MGGHGGGEKGNGVRVSGRGLGTCGVLVVFGGGRVWVLGAVGVWGMGIRYRDCALLGAKRNQIKICPPDSFRGHISTHPLSSSHLDDPLVELSKLAWLARPFFLFEAICIFNDLED